MENSVMNIPEGQEQMSRLIDFNGWSFDNNVPIKTARDVIQILQNHYPERLAIVILYNPPRILEAFWKKMFQKIKFAYPTNKDSVELMKSFFDTENLPSEFGGKATLRYDHEEFSRLMAQDDVKTAAFWGLDYNSFQDTKDKCKPEANTEQMSLVSPAS
ncbi:hypothetical protein BUALT_Bualt11G0052100 [Buddleja alternifolia]|uniref:CRAL-TRIO domain-containing protein n=1 Tax=Buddleja alternifolia TaxID=168488 RepID=A0AAV6WT31_9LAMI|nr:hypothetical protein BUALT_Bualt11G0052100 [Buddleja alternifolia]